MNLINYYVSLYLLYKLLSGKFNEYHKRLLMITQNYFQVKEEICNRSQKHCVCVFFLENNTLIFFYVLFKLVT